MKKVISILLVLVMCFSICACSISEENQNSLGADNNISAEPQRLSESDAIYAAKNDSTLKNVICSKFALQFYSIDWGHSDAYYVDGGDSFSGYWVVTLYGNISGYTDYYKTDYVIAEPFECEVRVSDDGDVGYPSVSKG